MGEKMERIPNLMNIDYDRYPFPLDVIVETCCYCNLSCIICPYPTLMRSKGYMTFETFRKIVDEVALENPSSRLWVAILGEPLIRGEDLVSMLVYARDKGLKNIFLNTNATYLDEAMTDKLLGCGLKEILVSFDAATKETYDKIRCGGDFPRVVRNVCHFLEEKARRGVKSPKVIAQFIVMDENEHEIETFKNFWLSRGAFVKVRLKMGWGSAVDTKDLDNAQIERNHPCPWLLRSVSIHWDGTFAQCDADFEGIHSPGSIKKQTIKEIWEGELAKRRDRHWNLDFSFAPCETCRDWSVGRASFFYPNGEKSEKKQ